MQAKPNFEFQLGYSNLELLFKSFISLLSVVSAAFVMTANIERLFASISTDMKELKIN